MVCRGGHGEGPTTLYIGNEEDMSELERDEQLVPSPFGVSSSIYLVDGWASI